MNQNDILLIVGAVLGTVLHWLQQRLSGNVAGNPIDYLIHHPSNTISMVVGTITACGSLVMSEQAHGLSAFAAAYLGFITGYAMDAGLNKGPRPGELPPGLRAKL